MSHARIAIPLLAAITATGLAQAEDTHPFSVHDMLAMERISGTEVSPDGSSVVFTLRTTDLEANRGRTDLWQVGIDGSDLRQLTSHEASDHGARFSPDGKTLWFLSSRTGSSQVWRIALDGGEATQVTDLPLDVHNLVVSPTGDRLAFTLEVFPDCDTLECTAERLAEREAAPTSGVVYEQLLYRHWDHWRDGRRSHLFTLRPGESLAVDLTAGADYDVPSSPFGGPEEIAFSTDGELVVFAARDAGREEAWSTDFDLYWVPADGSSAPENFTDSNPAWDTQPAFSPDGKTLAWKAMERAGYESDRFRIVVRDIASGATRVVTEEWDRSPGSLAWSADSRTLYVTASHLGHRALFAVDVASGAVTPLVTDGFVSGVAVAGDRIVFGLDHLRSPVELHHVAADGSDLQRITRINDTRVAAARMGEPEQFTFAGWNGETVHAWVVKPVDFAAEKKYPLAFLIHGGPQGSFGNHFHYRWNPQAYAGAGYAAVMVDFHGSTGYGQAFTDSIRDDWGGKPLEDLQKGLAAALERYPWIDGDRVSALGASYGGYMVNWIAGSWPDRFRCLVNHDGLFDLRFSYFDTEELWFPEWEHLGTPWTNPEAYARHSPSRLVGNWKTPMLVVHGALDFRVPEGQGMATFTALQRRGIPSQLLYFPDENHWVLKPHNSIQWHETVLAWLDRWSR